MNTDPLVSLLDAAANNPVLQFIAIVIGTFILEDAMTIFTGLQVATGALPAWIGLLALYVGIALGDVGLFGLGWLAARHRWARRYVTMSEFERAKRWLNGRLVAAVISTRFLPGARLPTYTACGFLGVSFERFVASVIIGTIVWTTMLFTASLGIGMAIEDWLGKLRWPIGIAMAILFVLIGRRIVTTRLARTGEAPPDE
jgi:membrane protein DedA with SNARE-associated domain